MIFCSSVLHIVVEPATDCRRYVGVEDTIEHLVMVHIVEYSCQIEPDALVGRAMWFFAA